MEDVVVGQSPEYIGLDTRDGEPIVALFMADVGVWCVIVSGHASAGSVVVVGPTFGPGGLIFDRGSVQATGSLAVR
jgi:hypothetical protein